MLRDFLARAARHDSDARPRQVPQERRVRLAQMEHHRASSGASIDSTVRNAPRFGVFTEPDENRVERELHVGGSERTPVVEFHARPQMKHVRQRVGAAPSSRRGRGRCSSARRARRGNRKSIRRRAARLASVATRGSNVGGIDSIKNSPCRLRRAGRCDPSTAAAKICETICDARIARRILCAAATTRTSLSEHGRVRALR